MKKKTGKARASEARATKDKKLMIIEAQFS
jgi:hypothetical protein